MKKTAKILIFTTLFILTALVFLAACIDGDSGSNVGDRRNTVVLGSPQNLRFDEEARRFVWDEVENATGYNVFVGGRLHERGFVYGTTYLMVTQTLQPGLHYLTVQATGTNNAGTIYMPGAHSNAVQFRVSAVIEREIDANFRFEDEGFTWDSIAPDAEHQHQTLRFFDGDNNFIWEVGVHAMLQNFQVQNGLERLSIIGANKVRLAMLQADDYFEIHDGVPTFFDSPVVLSKPFVYNVVRLDAPPNVRMEEGAVVWGAVENATNFRVGLYKDEQYQFTWNSTLPHATTLNHSYSLLNIVSSNFEDSATYHVRIESVSDIVKTVAGMPTLFARSEYVTFSQEVEFRSSQPVQNLRIEGNAVRWDHFTDFAYDVFYSINVRSQDTNLSWLLGGSFMQNHFNLWSIVRAIDVEYNLFGHEISGLMQISITADSGGRPIFENGAAIIYNRIFADYIEVYISNEGNPPTNIVHSGSSLTWDAVMSATGYLLIFAMANGWIYHEYLQVDTNFSNHSFLWNTLFSGVAVVTISYEYADGVWRFNYSPRSEFASFG